MATPSCPNNCLDRTRPGSRRLLAWHTGGWGGTLAGGRRPSWRELPSRRLQLQGGLQLPSAGVAPTEGRGRGGAPAPVCCKPLGWLPGLRRARPSRRGRPGPGPGAFRAQKAACPGKSRPPSRRRGPARQRGGRGFPESARRQRWRHGAEQAHIWVALP